MKKINRKCNNYFLGGMVNSLKQNFLNNKQGVLTNAFGAASDIGSGLIPSSGSAKTDAITGGISAGLETVGSAFGPIGGAIGKAAGLLTKGIGALIGSKGSVNTDTGEMTKGKGIKGRRNRNKLEAQWRRVNQGISDAELTSLLLEEYMNEYGDNDFSLAADGGILPTTLAYLDDGELGRMPNGDIFEVPEENKPTDSNLVKVPVGTQILSDKLKVPGTNKTFAQKGKEIMKTTKYKGSDIYAENSKKLNDINALNAYNNLLALQESMKTEKQSKKNGIKSYYSGTARISKNPRWNDDFDNKYGNISGTIYSDSGTSYNNFPSKITEWLKDDNNLNTAWNDLGNLPQVKRAMSKSNNDKRKALAMNYTDGKYGEVHDWFNSTINSKPHRRMSTIERYGKLSSTVPDFSVDAVIPTTIDIPEYTNSNNKKNSEKRNKFNTSGLIGDLSGLIAPISSIASAKPEKAKVFTYSPQFAPTEYDINPILREIDLSNSIMRYNINQAGGAGTGANLAQAIQGQVARDKAISRAYNQKLNIENERKARNIGIYNDWARYNTEAQHRGYVEDAQNRAAADNIRRTGIRDLGTALQTIYKDRRMGNRDKMMLEAMKPYLEYGMTKDQLNNIYNYYR